MTQGKCVDCKTVYIWDGHPLLREAVCPWHRRRLERTSYLIKWPTVQVSGSEVL